MRGVISIQRNHIIGREITKEWEGVSWNNGGYGQFFNEGAHGGQVGTRAREQAPRLISSSTPDPGKNKFNMLPLSNDNPYYWIKGLVERFNLHLACN
jgi:hypothetical protein